MWMQMCRCGDVDADADADADVDVADADADEEVWPLHEFLDTISRSRLAHLDTISWLCHACNFEELPGSTFLAPHASRRPGSFS